MKWWFAALAPSAFGIGATSVVFANDFEDLRTEMTAARKSLVTLVVNKGKRGSDQQMLVKETTDKVCAHLAKMKAPAGKEAQCKELSETWAAFKKTREADLSKRTEAQAGALECADACMAELRHACKHKRNLFVVGNRARLLHGRFNLLLYLLLRLLRLLLWALRRARWQLLFDQQRNNAQNQQQTNNAKKGLHLSCTSGGYTVSNSAQMESLFFSSTSGSGTSSNKALRACGDLGDGWGGVAGVAAGTTAHGVSAFLGTQTRLMGFNIQTDPNWLP
jgi:hypothetical protein